MGDVGLAMEKLDGEVGRLSRDRDRSDCPSFDPEVGPPNPHNTMSSPLVEAVVYADRSRDTEGRPTAEDAQAKALAVIDAVDKVLHRPDGGEIEWDGLRIVSSVRHSEPDMSMIPEGGGAVRATARNAVTLG
jgi:hypothetical protein